MRVWKASRAKRVKLAKKVGQQKAVDTQESHPHLKVSIHWLCCKNFLFICDCFVIAGDDTQAQQRHNQSHVPTDRIVGDNLNKTNPRYMTFEHQHQSLYYFHS